MNLLTVLITAAVIVFVLIRRFAGEPLEGRRLVILPLAVTVIGATQLGDLHFSPLDVAVLAVEGLAAAALGAVRGTTVQVYSRDGHLWYRYRPLTIAVWIASILLRVLQTAAGHALGADSRVLGVPFAPRAR
jgi:hypothetical protein